jgi:hypothetical protein
MNNKNMTAVEWLVDQLEKWELYNKISFQCLKEIEQAKAMEKEQIENAYRINPNNEIWSNSGIDYYNETYGYDK